MAEVAKASTDDWWVMGDTEGHYLHWKGNGISGCYVQWCDPETAERFDTKDKALAEIASDLVRKEFGGARGEIVPLHVEKRIEVSADL